MALRAPAPQMPPPGWQAPARGYAVCTLPRSGSNLLCDLLSHSGQAGSPAELLHDGAKTAAPRPAAEWMTALAAAGTRQDGPFAIKLFPEHLARLELKHGIRFFDWFPDLKLILLRRRDLLAQAVSLAIARQTGSWVKSNPGHHGEARYDAAFIAAMLDRLVEWEAYWRRHIAISGSATLELVYEDFEHEPPSGANAALAFLGLPPIPADTAGSDWLGRQGSGLNLEWCARFREDLRRGGYLLRDRPRRARPDPHTLLEWLGGRLTQPAFRPRRRD
jgi:LPS sulfotransferase NodH